MTKEEAIKYLTERGKDTLIDHLGIKFVDITENGVVATMPVNNNTRQVSGILNGGASLALAECLAGSTSALYCAEDEVPVGMQVSGSHVSAAMVGDVVVATSTLIHRGKSTHLVNVDIRSQNTGKLVSTSRVQNFIKKLGIRN